MAHILVMEDDLPLSDTVKEWLSLEQHKVDAVATYREAEELMLANEYDVVILDWMVPDGTGVDLCKRYRSRGGTTPIILLTGKSTIQEKEIGLDSGADDYMTKPFHVKELAARVRALLRRPRSYTGDVFHSGSIKLEPASHKVSRNGEEIQLQPMEFALLEFLMRHPNEVFSPEALLRRIWVAEADASLDALYTCIKRLRKKIDVEGEPSIIRTVHGVGYKLRDNVRSN